MSELKSYYYYEDRVITPATHRYRVYHADDADKVIAELKHQRDGAFGLANLGLTLEDLTKLARKEIDRHKYKRCLAMAKWCFTKSNYHFVLARHGEDAKENNRKSILYSKWHNRWMELADEFKPNNKE